TKRNPDPIVGVSGLHEAHAIARAARVPLVAIGGIDVDNVFEVAPHCDSAAIISGLVPNDAAASDLDLFSVTARARTFASMLGTPDDP
ncbi:hypothetical protein, partial [Salmonella sp. M198]|uniref:hypothetical protein n=1 Tax=Salmonella sp. M198 TaxID=3240293 RepID=UPI00352B4A48